jgi:hypothetical protein
VLVLPDQSKIPDATSPTGYLMSPYNSASNVAAAGRVVGATYRSMMNSNDPNSQEAAFGNMIGAIGADLGTGGKFDYQRQGNFLMGFDHGPQFRNVANFNVGL